MSNPPSVSWKSFPWLWETKDGREFPSVLQIHILHSCCRLMYMIMPTVYIILHTAAISQKDWWLPSTLSLFLHWSEIVIGAGRAWHDRGSLDLFFGRKLTAHQWDLISACWHITFIDLVPSLTPPTAWYTPWVRVYPQEAWLVSPHTQTNWEKKDGDPVALHSGEAKIILVRVEIQDQGLKSNSESENEKEFKTKDTDTTERKWKTS